MIAQFPAVVPGRGERGVYDCWAKAKVGTEKSAKIAMAKTATEAAILTEKTTKRIKMKLRLLEKGFLVDI